ncbi:hypothetical protein PLICRDRAFT_180293 [Plicaturopsis crispa FD-325 SS-3]|uniref:Uncharacterized protein n=1 Tax=Plicaturopsis crispa FD-325 SS-3 TaxID=944288 RepID=A0A0C9SW55_PLICR|nr:hypothetical protein PLICRDRAFT_180293 [Plicaturopsis crispa FD-325 SS-3]
MLLTGLSELSEPLFEDDPDEFIAKAKAVDFSLLGTLDTHCITIETSPASSSAAMSVLQLWPIIHHRNEIVADASLDMRVEREILLITNFTPWAWLDAVVFNACSHEGFSPTQPSPRTHDWASLLSVSTRPSLRARQLKSFILNSTSETSSKCVLYLRSPRRGKNKLYFVGDEYSDLPTFVGLLRSEARVKKQGIVFARVAGAVAALDLPPPPPPSGRLGFCTSQRLAFFSLFTRLQYGYEIQSKMRLVYAGIARRAPRGRPEPQMGRTIARPSTR